MAGKVQAQTMGTAREFAKSLQSRGGGAASKIKHIPKDDNITVRFLQDPDEWVKYREHYDEGEKRFFPCTEDCEECQAGNFASTRYLGSAYVQDDQEVRLIKMPKTLAEELNECYQRFQTLKDRDYTLSRRGSTQTDTKYKAFAEAPTRFAKARRLTPLDALAVLQEIADEEEGLDDMAEGNSTPPKRTAKRRADKMDDHPGGMSEFKPRKRGEPSIKSTKNVADEDDPCCLDLDEEGEDCGHTRRDPDCCLNLDPCDHVEPEPYKPAPRRQAVAKKLAAKRVAKKPSKTAVRKIRRPR